MIRLRIWLHERKSEHVVLHTRVTPPLWDRNATGDLWTCWCGKQWAR